MRIWFECKVCYQKLNGCGQKKNVTESYLVDALSFTEAESRIIEELMPFIDGDFLIKVIKRANYTEWFPSDDEKADKWYSVKSSWITIDEKSGKEKRSSWFALVAAESTADAEKRFHNGMQGTLADYVIEAVVETSLLDVFPYSEEGVNDENR